MLPILICKASNKSSHKVAKAVRSALAEHRQRTRLSAAPHSGVQNIVPQCTKGTRLDRRTLSSSTSAEQHHWCSRRCRHRRRWAVLFIVAADAVVVDVGLGLFVGCFCFGFCFSFRNTFKPYSRCQRHRRHCRRQRAFLAVCAQEIQNPIGKHTCRQVLNTHTHNSNVTAFKHSVRACIIYVLYISKNTNNNKYIYYI